MTYIHSLLGLGLLCLLQGHVAHAEQVRVREKQQAVSAYQTPAIGATTRKTLPVTSYKVRYDRYGVFGIYHVTLAVDEFLNGVHQKRLYIDGAGRPTKMQFTLGPCKIKLRLPPAYLAAYVNPIGYKKHFLGLLTSNEFGPTYTLSDEQGKKLITMAHHAMTTMNSKSEMFYSTIPFHCGPLQFWTSNSIVASLVKVANEEGIQIANPSDGYYPGFDGPFLLKSHFQ